MTAPTPPRGPAFDPAHPDWCPRDSGCVLPTGHDGDCDLTAALDPTPAPAGGVGSGEPKVDLDASAKLSALSRWVDEAPANAARDKEAALWGRVAKVGDEFGEVIAALIGATGQNPRKGVTHCMDDVEAELLDVALTALCAVEHLSRNRPEGVALQELADKINAVYERAGLGVDHV